MARPVIGITDVREAIAWQANHADKADAPITGRVVRAELAILDTKTELARRMTHWPGLSLEDAMPLRVAAGLHWLHLSGVEERLAAVYSGAVTDQAHLAAVAGKAQRAAALVVERGFGHDAGARHHRQRLVEDAALGHGEGKRCGHRAGM